MKNSPTGSHIRSTNFKIVDQTNVIPGKIGQQFGMEYIINAKVNRSVIVENVWIFPEAILDEDGMSYDTFKYEIRKYTNDSTYTTYTLEKDYEIVKGEWIFQMYYEGKMLHERKFLVE